MHLDQIIPLLSTNVAATLEFLAVEVGLVVIFGSLKAAIRDKDFSPREIARFIKSEFFSPEYAALLGLMAGAAIAPDVASRTALLALLTASASALAIRLGAQLITTLKALAGFPDAAYGAPSPIVALPSAPAAK